MHIAGDIATHAHCKYLHTVQCVDSNQNDYPESIYILRKCIIQLSPYGSKAANFVCNTVFLESQLFVTLFPQVVVKTLLTAGHLTSICWTRNQHVAAQLFI